jgi:hypothetical protein
MTAHGAVTATEAPAPTSTNKPAPLMDKNGRRLTAAERAALTPTAQVDPKAAHDLLANKEQINPAVNDKPVKGASVQRNRKGADPKPAAKSKRAAPAPKQKAASKKADKEPAEPKAPRVVGRIRPHPELAKRDNVPTDVVVHVDTLNLVRKGLKEGETMGAWARTQVEAHPNLTPQVEMPGGRGTRTIMLPPSVVKTTTAIEKSDTSRFANFLYARMLARLK